MESMQHILDSLEALDAKTLLYKVKRCEEVPSREEVTAVIEDSLSLMFPAYFRGSASVDREAALFALCRRIRRQIALAASFAEGQAIDADAVADAFIAALPQVKATLLTDIEAIYEGDPAVHFRDEVLICYPGLYAIAVYRLAHKLYQARVPLLPRMMTEHAHGKTGIDIHPGATIGEYFCIDHGTGIVVGETTVIGDHVKLYQGVTLGAKSFELDENGNPVKGIKRHPQIGDHTVIYANATILGGNTAIGRHCVIGGNTWIVKSVPDGETVYREKSGL